MKESNPSINNIAGELGEEEETLKEVAGLRREEKASRKKMMMVLIGTMFSNLGIVIWYDQRNYLYYL